ncbi:MAG: 50S ribosomal protein L18 [Bacteroidales bacterium]
MALTKLKRRKRIKMRIRRNISGTEERPRMTVFRSNREMYVQLIDDLNGKTLIAASSLKKDEDKAGRANKTERAKQVGKLIAEKSLEKGISNVVFDRNGYLYHGRVKALADAAREGGLKF